ncbi:MAG: hypothetical protein ACOCYG_09920, partial [Spirochaetota bacterium]
YYESPLIIAGVDTAMNTISLKPTEFTVTVEGRVWRDDEDDEGTGSGDGELQKGDSGDTPTNGEEVVLTVTDPASGNTRTHRTRTERSGVGSDAEDGIFSISGVTWKDSDYSGTQSTAMATITVKEATTIHLPSGGDADEGEVELISGTDNYVEVLFD